MGRPTAGTISRELFFPERRFRAALLWVLLFPALQVLAQGRYSTANAHAHNDYLNTSPFHLAYNHRFGSIEADVFPVNGTLLVAHSKRELQPARTLTALYLQPLQAALAAGSTHNVRLLVDIKENYKVALPLLVEALRPLQPYLSTAGTAGRVTVLISGNRPPPAEYKDYPAYILFDNDLRQPHTPEQWARVGLVSLPFTQLSAWKGGGRPPRADRQRLRHTIDSVHAAGKPIRFWAAPDTPESWKWQMKWGADLIGTDRITALDRYLERKARRLPRR